MGSLVLGSFLSIITRTKSANLTYGPSVASLDIADTTRHYIGSSQTGQRSN